MVEMGVSEQKVRVDRRPLLRQSVTESAQAGAGIKDQQMVAASQFNAGGIAAITLRQRPRHGDAAARTPKSESDRRHLFQLYRIEGPLS